MDSEERPLGKKSSLLSSLSSGKTSSLTSSLAAVDINAAKKPRAKSSLSAAVSSMPGGRQMLEHAKQQGEEARRLDQERDSRQSVSHSAQPAAQPVVAVVPSSASSTRKKPRVNRNKTFYSKTELME